MTGNDTEHVATIAPTDDEMRNLKELIGGYAEDDEKCMLAMKAAFDTLSMYCGGTSVPIEVCGVTMAVPTEAMTIARESPELSRDARIEAVSTSEWCRETASDLCIELFDAESGTTAHDTCIGNVANKIAAEIVG